VPARGGEPREGTILVVDDEPIVRKVVARMLERAGHSVVVASSGSEGVDTFASRPDEIAAVVVDLTMPDIGGGEVLARVRGLRPGIPVVLMSGYTQEDFDTQFTGKERVAFLHKPFREAELAAALEAAWRSETRG
jgi:CheY-like chemotaxis protein